MDDAHCKESEEARVTASDTVTLYTDGASRGNPGDAAWAYVIVQGGSVAASDSGYIGIATNNVAEYRAVINGLRAARRSRREGSRSDLTQSWSCASSPAGTVSEKNT